METEAPGTPVELILSSEAARILGCGERTVKDQAKRKKLPYVTKLAGRTGAYLFDRAVIEQIATQRKVLDDIVTANREAVESVRGAA